MERARPAPPRRELKSVDDLEERAKAAPDQPGVYLFRDQGGKVLYVGKAASLRKRLRSYSGSHSDPRVRLMLERAHQLEYLVTKDAVEALVLELNLIKVHRPPFNIRMRDDKHYPYLRVTLEEEYPRLLLARKPESGGSRYFGPFTRAGAVRSTMDLCRRLFPQRTCGRLPATPAGRACLNFHLGRCPGPCTGKVEKEGYRAVTSDLILFLQGHHTHLIRSLTRRMEEAAERMDFEGAALWRDRLRGVREVVGSHPVVSPGGGDGDVLAFACSGNHAAAAVLCLRQGKLVGRESVYLTGVEGWSRGRVMTALVEQYYQHAAVIPPEVMVSDDLEDASAVREWLRRLRGGPVRLFRPRRGFRSDLVQMAGENAGLALDQLHPAEERQRERAVSAAYELAQVLQLPAPPRRLEGFDVSNLQGKQAVAAMVAFIDGLPEKSGYRKFRIQGLGGPDDYAMLRQAIHRRFARGKQEREEGAGTGFSVLPDLLVVDGGRGQLNVALEALEELGITLPVAALAKTEEEIYVPGRDLPLRLSRESTALQLLQRLRDEAHRFALGYHRVLRARDSLRLPWEEVPGIGPRRKAALLARFGSTAAMGAASVEELAQVPGMNRQVAKKLKDHLEDRGAGVRH